MAALICLWGTGSKTGLIVIFLQLFIGVFLLLPKRKYRCIFVGMTSILGMVAIMILLTIPGENVIKKIKNNIFREKVTYELEGIQPEEEGVRLDFANHSYYITIDEKGDLNSPLVWDEKGNLCTLSKGKKGRFVIDETGEKKLKLSVVQTDDYKQIVIYWKKIDWVFESKGNHQPFYYINPVGKQDIIEKAPAAFGQGREKAITGRIYLWSRTIPLLKKTLVWGSGPDTYACVFPQNDYIARANTGEYMLRQLLTKAHSFYLQTAVQTGVLSLAVLLYSLTKVLAVAVKKLRAENIMSDKKYWYLALLLSIVGFLLMGVTNDSVVVTTPIFCVILGLCMNERIDDMKF